MKVQVLTFKCAIRGIRMVFRTEKNAAVHLVIAALVALAGLILGITRYEWFVVVLSIGLVIGAEIFNTAIERLVDLVSPGFNEKAGMIKDISAGAVLIMAITSAIAGLVIFIPYIVALFK